MIKQGIASLDSMFLVPGEEAEFETTKDVPHGEVRIAWYRSGTLDALRSMHVYTPPGYEGDVGASTRSSTCCTAPATRTRAGARSAGPASSSTTCSPTKKAVPMIVVMPNGSLPRPANLPRFDARHPAVARGRGPRWRPSQNRFTDELLKEVVPFVEKHYRVQTGRENRAIAGLSMGGGQTLRVVTTHPDEFAYVGIWSAGLFGGNADEFEKRNESFLKDAERRQQDGQAACRSASATRISP